MNTMASRLTILGDLSNGIGPHLSHYSQPGLEWSVHELKQARALRVPSHNNHTEGGVCSYCEHLLEVVLEVGGVEKLTHQPGYRALSASASKCSLCFIILLSLDRGIPPWVMNDEMTKNTEQTPLENVVDKIEIISLPASPTIKQGLQRFNVTWSSTGFHWVGETMGIYKHPVEGQLTIYPALCTEIISSTLKCKCLDAPSEAIWTSFDGENFDARFPVIDGWIQQCLDDHNYCSYTTAPSLPTRVLDIGTTDSTSPIRLISSNGLKADFAALSHCWGGITPLTTTKATLASRMQQIEMSELHKTFQEVVQIVRRLNIRYLWIDTLCIIQDDPKDWMQESVKMCQVYRDAYVNIAASAAADCTAGLIHRFVPSLQGTSGKNDETKIAIRISGIHSRQRAAPLEVRAWTLQEDLLARRVLYFAERQLLWRCKAIAASEDGLLDGLEYEESTLSRMRRDFVKLDGGHRAEAYQSWRRLAETYSRRKVTFEKDRLPALAGITPHFRDLLGDEPILGLWRDELVAGLLWVTHYDAIRSPVQGIPSWSWMSIKGGINYDELWFSSGHNGNDYYADPKLEICSATVIWSATPLSSSLESSKLVVRGFLLQVSLTCDRSNDIRTVQIESSDGDNSAVVGSGAFDVNMDSLPSNVRCLHVATITSFDLQRHSSRHGTYVVMLLRPMKDMPNTYLRIGLGRLKSGTEEGVLDIVAFEQRFAEADEATINLI